MMPWDHLEFFPEGLILLQAELATGLHPELEKQLGDMIGNGQDDWEVKLARIAAYCGIICEGVYDKDDISGLAAACAGRLEVMREIPHAETIRPLN